jgi:hypothetical protein
LLKDPNIHHMEVGANLMLDHLVTFDPETDRVGFTRANCEAQTAITTGNDRVQQALSLQISGGGKKAWLLGAEPTVSASKVYERGSLAAGGSEGQFKGLVAAVRQLVSSGMFAAAAAAVCFVVAGVAAAWARSRSASYAPMRFKPFISPRSYGARVDDDTL